MKMNNADKIQKRMKNNSKLEDSGLKTHKSRTLQRSSTLTGNITNIGLQLDYYLCLSGRGFSIISCIFSIVILMFLLSF